MGGFEQKCVFVTGGAQGIGAQIVRAFATEGAKVIFCDVDKAKGEELAEECGAEFHAVDVADAKAFEEFVELVFEWHEDLDIIVNNVGVSEFTPLVETSVEQFDRVLGVNLRSAFITSKAMAVKRNSAEGRARYGRIINLSSTRHLQSEPNSEAYAASKGGVVSLTHALAISFAEYNVTVNCISPGWINNGRLGELCDEDHRQHPSGRVGIPADIARAVLFLADEKSDFINGQNFVIDGGMTKKMIYAE